jgi:hypothetical protein
MADNLLLPAIAAFLWLFLFQFNTAEARPADGRSTLTGFLDFILVLLAILIIALIWRATDFL